MSLESDLESRSQLGTVAHYAGMKVKTMKQAILHPSPSLAVIKRFHGVDRVEEILDFALGMIPRMTKVKNQINEDMMEMLLESIMDDYYFLQLSEIKLILKKGVMGVYGDFYERIGIDTVLSWFRKYQEEREGVWQQYRSEKQEPKSPSAFYNPEVMAKMKEFLNQKKKEKISDSNWTRLEDYYDSIGKDFNEIQKGWEMEYAAKETSESISLDFYKYFRYQEELSKLNS